jgi:ABC-type uncharacterized transport system permease subunit
MHEDLGTAAASTSNPTFSSEQLSSATAPSPISALRCVFDIFFAFGFASRWTQLPSAVAPSAASFSRFLRGFMFSMVPVHCFPEGVPFTVQELTNDLKRVRHSHIKSSRVGL